MTIIISAFPATGKSYFFNNQKQFNISCCDSDSSMFSWLPNGNRNPNFTNDYFNHIVEIVNSKKFDIVFISTHQEIRKLLIEKNIPYLLVCPSKSLKEDYIDRFKKRGNDEKFIAFMENNFDSLVNSCTDLFFENFKTKPLHLCSFSHKEQTITSLISSYKQELDFHIAKSGLNIDFIENVNSTEKEIRKLASIELIENIRPIEGADSIEVCSVKGWDVVIKKGEFREGETCIYVEIDSLLPNLPCFEFLLKNNE